MWTKDARAPPTQDPHSHQLGDLVADNDWVFERMTDSHIVAISHECQEETLCYPESQGEEYLGSTANQGNVSLPWEKVDHHFGDYARDENQVNVRELAKQEIHGGMKVGICPDEEDQAGVSCDGNDVDKEDSRDKEISMSHSWEKAQENEICTQCLISCLHVSSLPASPET